MTSNPLRLLAVALALLGLSGGRAQGQCIGFDRFPDDEPQSVIASGYQKAYIYHANGVERIVLQPSYSGVAKDFGVFLAVPEIPKIEKVDEALFSELHSLTTPRVIRAEKAEPRVQAAEESSWQGVSVISEQLVGIYEAMVLQASDRSSFVDWLTHNGYVWPKELEPVFDHYVRAGWFFVAMRVNRNVAAESRFDGPIQPVGVRFAQEQIVMPMKLTSLTPGGVDFIYYLVTDSPVRARNIPEEYRQFSQPLTGTGFRAGAAPTLSKTLDMDLLRTPHRDLAQALAGEPGLDALRRLFEGRLWLTKYMGHFDREDLGEDFVWDPVPPGPEPVASLLGQGGLPTGLADKALDAYRAGTRAITGVSLIADVFDTNEGYGKPTFVNGIHVGDLAAIGREGSDRWQTIEMALPLAVAHWLGEEITLRIDNYGREVPGKGRLADAYNLRSVRIVVTYEDGTTWESIRFAGPVCSVPSWKNCQGSPVKRWGDPVEIRF
jgi:hypothetical protein